MKKELLSVSVVIPAFNEERLIGSCLKALHSQTVKAFEIIVVNNNSTDATEKIAKSFSGVKVIHEAKPGITYARTAGFNAASGDIIARIDVDTIVSSNWIETISRELTDNEDLGAIAGNAAVAEFSPKGKFWGTWYMKLFRAWHERSIGVSPVMYGFDCALRKKVWEDVKPSLTMGDNRISEDLDVTICVLQAGYKVKLVKALRVKCHVFRSIKMSKMTRYYRTDGYTLGVHNFGNKKRRTKQFVE